MIKARLLKDGRLLLEEEPTPPHLDRELLAPTRSEEFTIGDVDQLDQYLATNLFSPKSFQESLQYGKSLYQWMLDENQPEEIAKFKVLDEAALILNESISGATWNILKTLDESIQRAENQNCPKLLQHFTSLEQTPERPMLDLETIIQASQRHLGQMRKKALSPSQRESLAHLTHPESGPVMVVNGPPGTGKTTLLQSVIASQWVSAALEETAPPLIVACSSNNQAVTNIIDSMKEDASQVNDTDLTSRWIPKVNSHGLFLAARYALPKAEQDGYMTTNFFDSLSKSLGDIRSYYLKQCCAYLGQEIETPSQAKALLHEQLVRTQQQLTLSLEQIIELHALYKQHGKVEEIQSQVKALEEEQQAHEEQQARIFQAWQDWPLENKNFSLWSRLLTYFLQPSPRYQMLLAEYKRKVADLFPLQGNLMRHLPKEWEIAYLEQEQKLSLIQKELDQQKAILFQMQCLKSELDHLAKSYSIKGKSFGDPVYLDDFSTQGNPLNGLDQTIRHHLFLLATHYWEARWLEEATQQKQKKAYQTAIQAWQHKAMLTPLMVSTFYAGPGYFSGLFDSIDLLIIDEAGQAAPTVASAMLAMAKQALLVGDLHQIEPVLTLPEHIDRGNAKRYGLLDDPKMPFAVFSKMGLCASSNFTQSHGNLLRLAQLYTPWQEESKTSHALDRGLWLKEHWRCLEPIIQYCNQLCYGGRLIPSRPEPEIESPFPPMGFFPTSGKCLRSGGSRKNPLEAEGIANWLIENQEAICQHYGNKPLGEIVGIVTPFAAQMEVLFQKLRGLGIKKIGTVHRFQGGEMPIILFSPVYDHPNQEFYFDRTDNMLNVAVSRAKDSFFAFGAENLLNGKDQSKPSGLLAKHLNL